MFHLEAKSFHKRKKLSIGNFDIGCHYTNSSYAPEIYYMRKQIFKKFLKYISKQKHKKIGTVNFLLRFFYFSRDEFSFERNFKI